jgi:hypothetical protein
MRNIPVALQTHIEGEVLSLTRCLKITRADGVVYRLTTHDLDLVVNGDVYTAGIPLEISALESTDTLAVDNAEITVGLDETIFKAADFDAGLYDNAQFELFLVNWEDTGDGIVYLKRGSFGDVEITEDVSAKIQLRGLTHLLQRPIVERYSLTCRVALGSKRCGVANIPTRVRRDNQKVKTWDWYLVPAANTTNITLTNASFETSGLANWTIPAGSAWNRANAFSAQDGTYYAEGGAGSVGQELVMYRDIDTVTAGMSNINVDDGDYTFDFSTQIAATSSTFLNSAKIFVEQYNSAGVTLKREETEWLTPDYQDWQGIGISTFVLPGCRTIRIGFINRVDSGSAGYVAFDNVKARFWTNEMSTWDDAVFRTVRIPAFPASEKFGFVNTSFEANGAVGNAVGDGITGWTRTGFFRVVSSDGGLSAQEQTYFLMGGDSGSTTPNSVYQISQGIPLTSGGALGAAATAANITAGWYYVELRGLVAKTDSDSAPRIVLECLNAGGTVLDSRDTGYITGLTEDTWAEQRFGFRVPSGTASLRVTLYARSGAGGSAANAAFDNIRVYFVPVAYEGDSDSEVGKLSSTLPTYDYDTNDFTIDGEAIVQARAPVFNYASVTGVTDNRVFAASAINDTEAALYSGRIVWLSGANAGKVSHIRIWNNTTKVAKLYDTLKANIQVGDKFVYAKGCDKTIARCADTFGNAHNFRGEPYLPGPARVIQFLAATELS